MSSIISFAKELIAPKVLVDTLRRQDSKELGTDTGKAFKKFIMNEFGHRGGKNLLIALRPWIDQFYLAFRKEIDAD
jgi:hypothetical protein